MKKRLEHKFSLKSAAKNQKTARLKSAENDFFNFTVINHKKIKTSEIRGAN